MTFHLPRQAKHLIQAAVAASQVVGKAFMRALRQEIAGTISNFSRRLYFISFYDGKDNPVLKMVNMLSSYELAN